jgi:hypothetical protein
LTARGCRRSRRRELGNLECHLATATLEVAFWRFRFTG